MTYRTQFEQPQHQQRGVRDVLRTATLILAILTLGLLAGIFVDWSNAVMPGLSDVDDRTFVEAFRALDDAITSPLFLLGFTGALPLIGLVAVLHLGADRRLALMLICAAFALYLAVVVITIGVNVPLNEKLQDAGPLHSDADFAAARAVLDETAWAAWNAVRAVASTLAFGCLIWALAVGRRV